MPHVSARSSQRDSAALTALLRPSSPCRSAPSTAQAWAGVWPNRGFVRVFEGALDEFDVVRRLLGGQQGERYATDLRHLVELCHAGERRTRVGPSGLASWLRASRDATGDGSDEAQALRLESDARAAQLVTIHKSKGLEYPVVLLPFGWADFQPSDGQGPLPWHATVEGRTERLERGKVAAVWPSDAQGGLPLVVGRGVRRWIGTGGSRRQRRRDQQDECHRGSRRPGPHRVRTLQDRRRRGREASASDRYHSLVSRSRVVLRAS